MKLGHGWVITCHRNLWILLLIHVLKRLDREDIGGHDVSRNKCGSKVKINVLVLRNWCLLFFQYMKKCIAHYGFTIIKSLQSGVTVFSSFPPPPLPMQWLFLFTLKLFELYLTYLGQRKYRSGKMYWMTFWWPWPKVTTVTLKNKNSLVCRIKWEPLNQSLQNVVALSLWSCLSPD